MPFVDYISLNNDDIIGIWKNNESLDALVEQIQPNKELVQQLDSIELEKRKKEFCITNLLLKELLGSFSPIEKTETGKPVLPNSRFNLSISHADLYSAIYLSEGKECGVDVEVVNFRINRIAPKFVSDYEELYVPKHKSNAYYTIIWCVKEAIYKWYAKRGLDFKENMIIHPITIAQSGGPVYFEFVKDGKKVVDIANYQIIDNHVIAWLAADEFKD